MGKDAKPEQKRRPFGFRLLSLLGMDFRQETGPDTPDDLSSAGTLVMGSRPQVPGRTILPARLGERYQVQRILGSGGYGTVFLVRDLVIGRLVALKLLHHGLRPGGIVHRHFIQEARIAGQLDHENIVVIYTVETDADCTGIVMEYLPEGSLASRLAERGCLAEIEALRILHGVLSGLSAAHQIKVTHRDIKPGNILFDPKGRPKVSDFGVAHLPREEGGVSSDSEFKPVGTPVYMSPEQLVGDPNLDGRSDLWSCGVILHEMLCGSLPFVYKSKSTVEEALQVVMTHDPGNPLLSRPELDPATVELLERLLARLPERRFQSSQEALRFLEPLISRINQPPPSAFPDQIITSPVSLLEDVMRLLLVDGMMSPPERREIMRRATRLGVLPEVARELEAKIRREMGLPSLDTIEAYETAVRLLAGDGELGDSDRAVLESTSRKLGITDIERSMIDKDAVRRGREK